MLPGNRNFEGRIHPETKMSYLASPPLVIAYVRPGHRQRSVIAPHYWRHRHQEFLRFLKLI